MIRRVSHRLRGLRRDQRGATLLEFAFVAPIMVLMIMAGLETGYTVYLKTIAGGVLETNARAASLEGATESQFDSDIRTAMRRILPKYARADENIILTKKNYTDYSRINAAEKITIDHNSNGVVDAPADWDNDGDIDGGDCWIDEDGNNAYGTNEGASGLGGSDDGVFYTVRLELPRLFPMSSMMGLSEKLVVSVRTLVINQPYGTQTVRPTVCRTV